MYLGKNIKTMREKWELSQSEMGFLIGATRGMIMQYEKRGSRPKSETVSNIMKLTGLTKAVLNDTELEIDEIPDLDDVTVVALDNYRSDPALYDEVPEVPDGPKKSYLSERRGDKLKSVQYTVPFMPVKAQAGYVRAIDQEMFLDALEKYALPPGIDPTGAILRYWEVQGDSMEGSDGKGGFKQGDIILTSQVPRMDWDNLRNFYVYVIVTAEAVLIKRVFCKNELEWVLISENEDNYPQKLIPAESVKEIWVYRRTWKVDAAPTKRFEIKV